MYVPHRKIAGQILSKAVMHHGQSTVSISIYDCINVLLLHSVCYLDCEVYVGEFRTETITAYI